MTEIVPNNETYIMLKYQTVVIGGGTAGCVAALASARAGVKTIVVERLSFLGGTSTGGQVTPMMHDGLPAGANCSSISKEIKVRLAANGNGAADICGNDGWFNPEMLKFTLEEMLMESGADLLYETDFIDAQTSDGHVDSIIVNNRAGKYKIEGKAFIDATADAAVAFAAGANCFVGDEIRHENQAMSLRFMLANVDLKRLDGFLRRIGEQLVLNLPFLEMSSEWQNDTPLCRVFKVALADGVITYDDGVYFQAFSVPGMPGVVSFNCPRIPGCCDTLDPFKTSNAIATGRHMIKRLHVFLKNYLEGFENCFIISVAQMPGIRESRRIEGKYLLTAADYVARAKFDDAVARTAYPIDIHGSNSDTTVGIKQMKPGEYMEVPYRCLIPDGIENLIACGRCISSDFIAQSAIRIQPTCRATGEAAGTAAALSVKSGIELSRIHGEKVREIMKSHGAWL